MYLFLWSFLIDLTYFMSLLFSDCYLYYIEKKMGPWSYNNTDSIRPIYITRDFKIQSRFITIFLFLGYKQFEKIWWFIGVDIERGTCWCKHKDKIPMFLKIEPATEPEKFLNLPKVSSRAKALPGFSTWVNVVRPDLNFL